MEKVNAPPQYYYLCNCDCGCSAQIGPVRKKISPYLVDIICGDCGEGTHVAGYQEDSHEKDFIDDKFGRLIK